MPFSDWPQPYLPDNDDTHSPPWPTWRRADCVQAGIRLALNFVEDPTGVANEYMATAADAYATGREHIADYRRLLSKVVPNAYDTLNANDFANIHHCAWLAIGYALTSLSDQNPHGDWGDPPPNGSVHPKPGDELQEQRAGGNKIGEVPVSATFYHFVPDSTGYYATGTADMSAPSTA